MDKSELLLVAMADKCRDYIHEIKANSDELPPPLRPEHLRWMCDNIIKNAEAWPASRLHRWIGFIQCALIANGALSLEDAKRMFDEAKIAYAEVDDDLIDHLDSSKSFRLEFGGEA